MVLLDPSDFAGFMEHGPPALAALETATDIISSITVEVRPGKGIAIAVPFSTWLTLLYDIDPAGHVSYHMVDVEPPEERD